MNQPTHRDKARELLHEAESALAFASFDGATARATMATAHAVLARLDALSPDDQAQGVVPGAPVARVDHETAPAIKDTGERVRPATGELRAGLVELIRDADAAHYGGPQHDPAGRPVEYQHLADAILAAGWKLRTELGPIGDHDHRKLTPGSDDHAQTHETPASFASGATNTGSASEHADGSTSAARDDLRDDLAELMHASRDDSDIYRWTFLDAADAILAAGWRPPLPLDKHGVGSLSEAIALALGDAYAGIEFEDPTFERGTDAVIEALREWEQVEQS